MDSTHIRPEWGVKGFQVTIKFFNRVAELAEHEGHHPDLHLTGYGNIAAELTTHAIDRLSKNDSIVAAKINELPVQWVA